MGKEIKYNLSEKAVIYGLSVLVGVIVSVLSLLLSAGLCLAADLSELASSTLSSVCAGTGAFVAGFIASKKIGKGGIINGLSCGGLLYLLILFLSLFISEGGFTLITLFHSLVTLLSAAIGGVLGVNSNSKRRMI